MATPELDNELFERVAQPLEYWFACQSADGVPELVLVGLLRGYADAGEEISYVPRSWTDHALLARPSVDTLTESNF